MRECEMNVYVLQIAEGQAPEVPDCAPTKLVVEDNIGESIHLHWRNIRFEMSVRDYLSFAKHMKAADEELEKWVS